MPRVESRFSYILNTDPRWASWNLGVFVCIRCSGIHRGMGTHISRVKSVDLDSWTDEQLQSILSWGNARANKYWESKLAAGHAPSDAKIENFIRTKYELKRWVMDGPMPDPATLDADGDDEVPLSIVKEKQSIEKKEHARQASMGRSRPPPQIDLIGGSDSAPPRASNGQPAGKAAPAPPKTTTKDSLLGLDFLGESSAPPRPASTPGVGAGAAQAAQSRPDLKQSILSLYASAPKPTAQSQQNNQQNNAFGGMVSPQQSQGSAGGFNDAFSSLSLSNPTSPKPPPADPFASLGGAPSSSRGTPQGSISNTFGGLSGGGFFDAKPSQPPVQSPPPNNQKRPSVGSGFGSFTSPSSPPPQAKPSSSAMGDLFDLSAPVSQTSPPPAPQPAPAQSSSVFNLSSPQPKAAAPAPSSNSGASAATVGFGTGMSGADVWGGNEWATPAPTSPPAAPAQKSPELSKVPSGNDFGWGNSSNAFSNTPIVPGATGGFNPAPKVTADEEFGGWSSSTGGGQTTSGGASKGGFGGDDDLFSNVWQ